MKNTPGFSTVELLITLFIAAMFLTSGYQLFGAIVKDSAEANMKVKAGDVAYEYLEKYKTSASNPCVASTPLVQSPVPIDGLSNVTISIAITCPYPATTSISKITSTVDYGQNPVRTISNATYVKP
jgi:type II secretory pathway pseudopilin PulG